MSELKSGIFSATVAISKRSVTNAKSLIPLDGAIRVWYGEYEGTAAELLADGILVASLTPIDHILPNSGVISIRAVTGTVRVHEVI